ncbi:MAG: hypothetical protein WCV00_19010 [Verrucomicrobiia bacterium]|jgi:hypothetical protein
MSAAKDAESVIAVLDNEIAHLSSVYFTYERLYRGDSDTRKLLSDSDSAFFSDLYIIYLNYISVAVSRLLDPEKTGTKSNLTIFTLISILKAKGYPEADALNQRLKDIKTRAYNFTDPRNQLVSHLDLDVNCIDPRKKSIPSFIKSEFEEFYRDTGKLMNDIRAVLGMPPNMYEWGIVGHGCGRKLIYRLKTASDHIASKNIEQADAGNRAKPGP